MELKYFYDKFNSVSDLRSQRELAEGGRDQEVNLKEKSSTLLFLR
jgi:hypothetical protein